MSAPGRRSIRRRATVTRLAWTALLAIGLVALSSSPVAAHGDAPVRTEILLAGPYSVAVLFYTVPRPGTDLRLLVVPQAPASKSTAPIGVRARAIPGAGNSGAPVPARTSPDPELPTATAVEQPLPTVGTWLLVFDLDGPAGLATARLPVTAAAADAIPVELAWAIASIPLVGLAAFAIAQRRWFLRAKLRSSSSPAGANGAG